MSKLSKTSTPGIYRRHRRDCPGGRCDCNYVATWWVRGQQRKATFRTLAEAKEGKRKNEQEIASGSSLLGNKILLHDYALEWIERYTGVGKNGYRETTRDGDRRLLRKYALRYFPPRTYLKDVSGLDISKFIAWLAKQPAKPKSKKGRASGVEPRLKDDSIRNALKPLKNCLATAVREGLILHNPTIGAALPHRPRVDDEEAEVQPFPGQTMEQVVSLVKPEHRLLFQMLSETGLRRSELFALQWRDLSLDGAAPYVKVRRALIKKDGEGLILTIPKSREAKRDVPISISLADELRPLKCADLEPVFKSQSGTWLNPDNIYARVLRPAMEEAGIETGGYHRFRHTVATRLFAGGRNAVQVQRFLGHSDPAFTLRTYVHLLDRDLGGPLISVQGNAKAMDGLKTPETNSDNLTVPAHW